ncbi:MAG: diacylglycerol/lipid kinase family protein [Gemmatimonadaceae bacterium]
MSGRVRIILNPAAGQGRGARRLKAVRAAFAVHGMDDLRLTEASGDEARLVMEALDDDVGTLVVVGGDGTWGRCAVALARTAGVTEAATGAARAGSTRMAFLAAGTGNDFAKNLRVPAGDPAALARLIAEGGASGRLVDLGRVNDQWFLNVAGFGFDVAVLRECLKPSWLRGPARYVAAALRELRAYQGVECRIGGATTIAADPATAGEPLVPAWKREMMVVFSNGEHFGGAFHIAPDARVDDGALDMIVVDCEPGWERVPLLAKALRGRHLADSRIRHARAARFTVAFREPPWFEADGELHRAAGAECEVAVVPGALRVVDVPAE